MRRAILLSVLLGASMLPRVSAAGDGFDGKWATTLTCEKFQGAQSFTYHFDGVVKNGHYSGVYGTVGEPASLELEGEIAEDGSAMLQATGWTGEKAYVPGNSLPKGTKFQYKVKAQFTGQSGTGMRVQGRPCSFAFQK